MSMTIQWHDVKTWLGERLRQPNLPDSLPPPQPEQLSTDSRSIRPGDWFFPIVGESFDGHTYIKDVMNRGAAGFFYDHERMGLVPADLLARGIAVRQALDALQALARGWRLQLPNLKLIALTGSTGKTTCKEMLGGILKNAGPAFATQASFNNEIGVPKSLLQLRPEHRFAALEFGARNRGNIRFLCEMAQPDVVGLINVGITHVGIFGSIEGLLDTKLEIFRNSPDHAVQVAFGDDSRIVAGAKKTGKKTLTFGRDPACDVRIVKDAWHADGTMTLELSVQNSPLSINLPAAHDAYPVNAAAAAALALAAGVPQSAIKQGLESFRGVKGRYQIHQLGNLTLIDDTYNASPDSMISGMTSLNRTFGARSKVLVLGDMLELGAESPQEHTRVGAFAGGTVRPDWLIVVGTDAAHIASGATGAGYPNGKILRFPNVDALLAANFAFAEHGSVLFAKASNGIKLSKLIDRLTKVEAKA